MNIIVCIKQIIDPELPAAKFEVDVQTNRVIHPDGIPPVMNPYDMQAVELALRIKEDRGAHVTVMSAGSVSAEDILRKALAMGVDQAVMIADPVFEDSDGFGTALILSRGVKKMGTYDLIFCGRQAADWDMGIVGSVMAEYLGIPVVTRARSVEVREGSVLVERVTTDGFEVFELELPALVTVSNEVGRARLPTGWGIIRAASADIIWWSASDLGIDVSEVGKGARRNHLKRLYIPSYRRSCEFITGEDPTEISANLASRLMAFAERRKQ